MNQRALRDLRATEVRVLRLATTTSTADSGLLETILPTFEEHFDARVEVVAVGTGQAIQLGERGDADVILVHDRKREDAFIEEGFGTFRRDVMMNDFVLVGPPTDPASVAGQKSASTALSAIAEAEAFFASRGDESGTHSRELSLWEAAGIPHKGQPWYRSMGQGMGETLIAANEMGAYTLTDRTTFLAMRDELPELTLMVGGETIASNPDSSLMNPYGVIPVNAPEGRSSSGQLAQDFVTWLTSPTIQSAIGAFGVERFGQPLFYPASRSHSGAPPGR